MHDTARVTGRAGPGGGAEQDAGNEQRRDNNNSSSNNDNDNRKNKGRERERGREMKGDEREGERERQDRPSGVDEGKWWEVLLKDFFRLGNGYLTASLLTYFVTIHTAQLHILN